MRNVFVHLSRDFATDTAAKLAALVVTSVAVTR